MKINNKILYCFVLSIIFTFKITAQTTTHTYDDLNRLTRTAYTDGTVINYTYDLLGNRIGMSVSPGVQLPIELLDFRAKLTTAGHTDLQWQVAAEVAVRHYHVQRSVDGRQWTTLDKLPATGRSDYAYQDAQVTKQFKGGMVIYYRLEIHDTDGSTELSPVRSVVLPTTANDWKLFPNPTAGAVQLELTLERAGQLQLHLFNAAGQLLRLEQRAVSAGVNQVALDWSDLAAGVYTVQGRSGEVVFVERVVIK